MIGIKSASTKDDEFIAVVINNNVTHERLDRHVLISDRGNVEVQIFFRWNKEIIFDHYWS
jgi:hypothetical protein